MPDARPAVWAGRLAAGLDPRAQRLNDSLRIDGRLWPEEIALSRAYGATLLECGVLTAAEHGALLAACDALEAQLAAGTATLVGEDVHSAVEGALERALAAAGQSVEPARRLHTGRSRNDQVATLLRMRSMRLCDEAVEFVRELERALVAQARRAGDLPSAAYTHVQPAQPILLAHFWLAHVAALERDEERFGAAREAADRMPLGAGAVAGTPLRYDRYALAQRLGFSRLTSNSLDAVGDRDFALEYLNAAAMLGVHLSRLAEDLVLACSPGFGWFRAPDGFSTGSSLLPQKRNPDLFELARGKCARFLANAQQLATLLKGLPSAYQKDLQEDKEAVFDTADELERLLEALPPAIAALEPDAAQLARALTPDLLAVELADALVDEGIPFRDAHRAVGQLWSAAEAARVAPAELPLPDRTALHPLFTDARLAALTVEAALARRSHAPGAGPGSVAEQLAAAQSRLGLGPGDVLVVPHPAAAGTRPAPRAQRPAERPPMPASPDGERREDGTVIRRARIEDVPAIAAVMARYVESNVLLPRPVSDLYQCIREFHVAEQGGEIVACAALRLLWRDLGEVRSLAVRPDAHGRGLGAALVDAVVADARALGLPRVIALTREVEFFERCGFHVEPRDAMPRKVWTDCVKCPRRHACDEIAVALDLVPGASEEAARQRRAYTLPVPYQASPGEPSLPVLS
ncbi:MAG TPA: argininosuccinate lyase [Candidatus Acidoferrales bacterium]|nr:argininosuccinate lyase [Candidatus Acidoferrales bacterium]